MKTLVAGLGALLAIAAAAQAGPCYPSRPPAPDTYGPGFYCTNECGAGYGPNYYLQPPFPPEMLTGPPMGYNGGPGCMGQGAIAVFPSHPFARSPRDFFMMDK